VHFGHLRLAEEAMERLALGGVRWIPAGQPAHRGPPGVSARQRLDMVRLAVAGNPRFVVDAAEVEADSPSYTVPTLERLRAELGAAQPLALLLGADAFAGLESWRRWRELFALAHIAISHRPGFPIAPDTLPPALAAEFAARQRCDAAALRALPAGCIVSVEMTQLAISATQIRQYQAAGRSARYLLPDKVLDYIQTHSLYRNT